MTSITLELDPDFCEKLEIFANKHGQSLSDSAYYLLNKGYEIEDGDEEEDDRPYNPDYVKDVLERLKELDEGKGVLVTIEELQAMIK